MTLTMRHFVSYCLRMIEGTISAQRSHAPTRWFQPELAGTLSRRIVDAACVCIVRWGWPKTTLEDIAREAGCSRATIYRTFPGGKDAVLEAYRRHAVASFFSDLEPALTAEQTLEGTLVELLVVSTEQLTRGDFQRRLIDDPASILPQISFEGLSRVLGFCRVFIAPHLDRFMPRAEANRVVEWVARLVLSYAVTEAPGMNLSDRATARRLVQTRILPGITIKTPPTPTRQT